MSYNAFIINNFIIPESDKNTTVSKLLEIIRNQSVEIDKLKAEVARLKKHPQKPKLKPSKIGQTDASIGQKRKNVKNDFRNKKNNYKKNIEIHETIRLAPPNIAEKILETGLRYSNHICADDTGLRHKGKNGYSTHIGNQFFAYFKSSYSKSRLNLTLFPNR